MDTQFLDTFLATVDSGSIAEAARRLDLTPASVAQRIRTLEAEIGIALVTRVGRTVRVTEAGQLIVGRARELLQSARELRTLARSDTPAGSLKLGAASTAITGVLPDVLMALTRNHPQLDIYVVPGISGELYQRVLDGELDAAVIVEPPFGLLKTCDWVLVREEPLLLIAPEEMSVMDPRQLLRRERFIRYDRRHWGGRLADNFLKKERIQPVEWLEIDALDAIAVMVGRGLGISLVPDWAPPWPAGLTLQKAVIHPTEYSRRLGILWVRNSVNIRAIRALIQQFRAVCQTGSPGA